MVLEGVWAALHMIFGMVAWKWQGFEAIFDPKYGVTVMAGGDRLYFDFRAAGLYVAQS